MPLFYIQRIFQKGCRWTELSRSDRLLFLQAFLLVPVVASYLHCGGLRQTQRLLNWLTRRCSERAIDQAQMQHTAEIVNLAAHFSPWGNCLKRSLVLWLLLRYQGVDTTLRIGVRREQQEFLAHAWIEHRDLVLNDLSDVHQQFSAFTESI